MSSGRCLRVVMAACAFLAPLAVPALAAQRMILFEEFTNNACIPCALVNPFVHQIMEEYDEVLVPVVWHTWWPNGADPFYQHNPPPIRRQVNLYEVNGVPDLVVDGVPEGIVLPPATYHQLTQLIDHRLSTPSPLAIEVAVKVTAEGVLAKVNVTVETPTYGAHRLYVALVEKHITTAPGPNGEEDFYWVFRRINNNDAAESGEPIVLSTPGIQQFEYDGKDFPMHPDYQSSQMVVCAWVQNASTLAVVQAGKGDSPYLAAVEHVGPHTRIGDANEVVHYECTLHNSGFDDSYDVVVSGVPTGWAHSYTTPEGTFSGPSSLPLQAGSDAPIAIELDSQGLPGSATITLTCTSQSDPRVFRSLEFQKLNGADVLVVDDDGGETREERFGEALDTAGVVWGLWDREWGDLDAGDLETAADATIWLTGDHAPTLTPPDRDAISGLLDGGGRLLLTGQEIAYDLVDPLSPNRSEESILWFFTRLHCSYITTSSGIYFLDGASGDVLGDGLSFSLEPAGVYAQQTPDAIGQLGGTNFVNYRDVPPWFGGTRFTDGNHKLVYLSFGLEGIYEDAVRALLLGRILEWFGTAGDVEVAAPPAAGFTLAPMAPNPVSLPAAIRYRLAAAGSVSLRIYDVGGRLVRTLVDGPDTAAEHRLLWNGRDDAGRLVPSGVYFYRLEAGSHHAMERLVIVR